jgi:hypothetical protein
MHIHYATISNLVASERRPGSAASSDITGLAYRDVAITPIAVWLKSRKYALNVSKCNYLSKLLQSFRWSGYCWLECTVLPIGQAVLGHNHSTEVTMKKVSLAMLVSLSALMGTAYAQDNGVTMSTDPAKAADVEQRAQDLQAQQQAAESEHSAMPAKHHMKAPHHMKAAKPEAASQ